MAQQEQPADLTAALCAVIVDELEWDVANAEQLALAVIRRWRSFERRTKPNKRTTELRTQDLIQGLRQASPIDPIYLAPGDFERLAPRLATILEG